MADPPPPPTPRDSFTATRPHVADPMSDQGVLGLAIAYDMLAVAMGTVAALRLAADAVAMLNPEAALRIRQIVGMQQTRIDSVVKHMGDKKVADSDQQ